MAFKFPTIAEDESLRQYNRGTDTLFREMDAANDARVRQLQELEDNRAAVVPQAFEAYQKGEDRSRRQLAEDERLRREAAAEARAVAEEQRNAERFGREGEEHQHKKGRWGAEDEALGMEMEAKKRKAAEDKARESYLDSPADPQAAKAAGLPPGATVRQLELATGTQSGLLGNTKTKAEINKLNAEAGKAGQGDPESMLKAAAPELGAVALLPASPERDAKVDAIAAKYRLDRAQAHAAVATEAAKHDKTPENTQKFRAEYNAQDTTKRTAAVVENYNRIKEVAANPDTMTGDGDIALIYSFIKMNDPTSTVGPGEYANAGNAGGVSQDLIKTYNSLKDGAQLSPETRRRFVAQAKNLTRAQLESQKRVDERYREISTSSRVDPGMVVDSYYGRLAQEFDAPPPGKDKAPPTMPSPPQDGDAQAAPAMTLEQKKARIEELKKRKAARGAQ